jgi:hypothetical protein
MRGKYRKIWLAGTAAVTMLVGGVLAVTAGSAPSRASLMTQLSQRAIAGHSTVELRRSHNVLVGMSPARATVPNQLSVRLPAAAARRHPRRLTVVFSMPGMNMWHAYTAQLRPAGSGRYVAAVPVLGMPGSWQLSMHIAGAGVHGAATVVAVRLSA